MQVIFSSYFIIFPCTSAKKRAPVVWRVAIFPMLPNVVVSIWIVFRASTFYKPRMLIRRVIYNHVHYKLHIPFMEFFYKKVKILHCSELIHNIVVITYVISIVIIGRLVYWIKINHIKANIF